MKKIIILVICIMMCGCTHKENLKQNESTEKLSREQILLDYAKKNFVGEEYELKESNLDKSYSVTLRGAISKLNITNEFDGCDKHNTRVDYMVFERSENEFVGAIKIYLSCENQTVIYSYYSIDNYTQGEKLVLE